MILSAISCNDELGWCRLANPLSGVLRNSVLILLFLLLLLWPTVPVLAFPVFAGGFALTVYVAYRVVSPVKEDGWYARAIFGERLLVCHGLRSIDMATRWRLIGARVLESVTLLVCGWALLIAADGWAIIAFFMFMLARAVQLVLTEAQCRAALRSAAEPQVGRS